jgi:hypothetical protein
VVCGNLGCDRGEVERAIDRALGEWDRRALLRDAADFAAPAKGGGAVSVDGVGELSSETIIAIPDHEEIDVLERRGVLGTLGRRPDSHPGDGSR